MGGSSGGSQNTTVQKADPWIGAQPFIKDTLQNAQNQFNAGTGSQFYPQDTLAGRSPDTENALNALAGNAYAGNPVASGAVNDAAKTLQGHYLDPSTNTHLKGIYDRTANDMRNQVGSVFASGGRYGGAYHQDALQRGLTDAANTIYGSQYQSERDNMVRAQALAPQTAQMQNFSANQLLGVGQADESRRQQEINADRERFEYNRDFPIRSLDRYSQIIHGTAGFGGGTSSSTTSSDSSGGGAGGILGGALGGASAGSMFGPWGAGIGAGIGILGSLWD